jgi:ribosome biogenesis GTPase
VKRRLTDQQSRRIRSAKKEKERDVLANLGEEQIGLVVSHFGNTLEVESQKGGGERFRCHARQNLGPIVVGDRVVFCETTEGNSERGLVTARQERTSLLMRPDVYKQQKEIAANVDQMFITMAAEPEVVPYFIDKYLVAAELQKIKPILLFNKSDLLTPEAFSKSVLLMETYRKIGYEALHVSIYPNLRQKNLSQEKLSQKKIIKEGVAGDLNNDFEETSVQSLIALRSLLRGKTSIFVGPSGVGKSALTNVLLGAERALVGEISAQNQKGCHTTTRSSLYHLPSFPISSPQEGSDGSVTRVGAGSPGNIIDSPGIREFGLWNITKEQAALGFVEFQGFLGRCKFRDCKHVETPGCALDIGVRENKISPLRLANFHRLLGEIQKFQG